MTKQSIFGAAVCAVATATFSNILDAAPKMDCFAPLAMTTEDRAGQD